MSPRQCLASVTVVAAALVIAACGGSSDDAADAGGTATTIAPETSTTETSTTETSTTEASTTEVVSEALDADEVPAETDPGPAETEPAPDDSAPDVPAPEGPAAEEGAEGADPSCLVGEWIVSQDEMNAYYDALEASFPPGAPAPSFDIVGNVQLTFTETEYVYVADFDLVLEVAGQSGTGDTTGTVSGTWDVVDGLVVTTLGSSDLEVTVAIAGVTLSGSEFANGLLNSAPINNARFDCAGPTIGFQTADTDGPGHDVLLTPA